MFFDQGLNTRVLTNGIGLRFHVLIILLIEASNFSISSIRCIPNANTSAKEGSWDEAVRTMTHISSRLKGRGMPTINCVVSNLNLEELPQMVHFAKAIGFTISFLPIELLENQDDGVRNWEARFIRYRPEMGLHSSDTADSVRQRVDKA